MQKIIVENTCISSPNGIKVEFAVSEGLKQYFKKNIFHFDYSVDVSNVPHGVAVIPFVCNVLPIIWLTDAILCLDELEEDFYECIEKLKFGYKDIYPNLQFKGQIECNKIRYEKNECNNRSLVFFSGGVDAVATLIAHLDMQPTLFSICGADIKLGNEKGWNAVMNQINEIQNSFNLSSIQCHSNFRDFINEQKLCELVTNLGVKDDYWHGFQHGIGLIGHAAPIAYQYGYTTHYIASSYTIRERGIITCASDPRIDNYVRFVGATVFHDQFEFNRQEKIKRIVDYCRDSKQYVKLRVCWITDVGSNCCVCEKCIRTIYGIMAECEDPRNYGFNFLNLFKMKLLLKYKIIIDKSFVPLWTNIIDRINEQEKGTTKIEWLRECSVKKLNNNKIKRALIKFKRIVRCL